MHRHFLIHKPHGYLSQFKYEKKRPKKLLGELYDFPESTMAIGRLDEDSEGLLLLTTDGMMSEIIRSRTIEKEYYAQVDGLVSEEAIEQLKDGVEIGFKGIRYTTKKCRQVRKMTAAVGFPTLRLVRIRVGNLHLQNLKAGEVAEVESFFDQKT